MRALRRPRRPDTDGRAWSGGSGFRFAARGVGASGRDGTLLTGGSRPPCPLPAADIASGLPNSPPEPGAAPDSRVELAGALKPICERTAVGTKPTSLC